MAFDYFYEEQSQQFAFYRIPKVLFTDNRFQKISTEGKVLYGLLLDRVSLSRENGWIDEEGRVYIIFTLNAIRQAMNCAEKSAIKYLTELEDFGLIERIRQGLGKPAIIYVKNFIDQYNLQVKTCNNSSSGPVEVPVQDQYNLQPNYTNNNNTDFNNTNPILSGDEERMGYELYLKEQLDFEVLKQEYPYDKEMIDGILEMILDVLCSKRKMIRIAGDDKPVNVVKGRFMKLTIEHIRYVMNCLQENTTKIRSIKQYMLLKTPKTDSSTRKVYIPKSVAQCLVELKAEQDEIKEALGNEYQDYNLVMATTFGLPIGDSYLRNKMQDIIDELGLPDVVFHSLRHTSVTYKLKLSGGDIKAVQGDSGHAQADMVTEVYGHIIDEDRRKNAEMMENAFYNKENLNPRMKGSEESSNTIAVPEGVDAELLMKVLGNPEMAALLTSLARTMKV